MLGRLFESNMIIFCYFSVVFIQMFLEQLLDHFHFLGSVHYFSNLYMIFILLHFYLLNEKH